MIGFTNILIIIDIMAFDCKYITFDREMSVIASDLLLVPFKGISITIFSPKSDNTKHYNTCYYYKNDGNVTDRIISIESSCC